MKILTIVGARPQIIKAAAISREIKNNFKNEIKEIIVHTGQHYDNNMSEVFFNELGSPKPQINLNVGPGSHGKQTAIMIEKIEQLIFDEKPNAIIVYGDTNSTLAAAIAASKVHLPIIHIEAGLRSFNKKMPEEINRIMCDHVSTLLFSPTKTGLNNLKNEGFNKNNEKQASLDNPKIYHCGDIMYDNSKHFSTLSDSNSSILSENKLTKGNYILSTIHRNDNTDVAKNLSSIFESFIKISNKYKLPIILPLHPRTKKMMELNLSTELRKEIDRSVYIKIIPPASFLDIIALEKNCRMIITDSGGIQKEAYFFKKPCVILRPQTEWIEILETGSAVIVGAQRHKIISESFKLLEKTDFKYPKVFGNGNAANFICSEIIQQLS
jgi:UDP-GlcNAc3NAcA epimerase